MRRMPPSVSLVASEHAGSPDRSERVVEQHHQGASSDEADRGDIRQPLRRLGAAIPRQPHRSIAPVAAATPSRETAGRTRSTSRNWQTPRALSPTLAAATFRWHSIAVKGGKIVMGTRPRAALVVLLVSMSQVLSPLAQAPWCFHGAHTSRVRCFRDRGTHTVSPFALRQIHSLVGRRQQNTRRRSLVARAHQRGDSDRNRGAAARRTINALRDKCAQPLRPNAGGFLVRAGRQQANSSPPRRAPKSVSHNSYAWPATVRRPHCPHRAPTVVTVSDREAMMRSDSAHE